MKRMETVDEEFGAAALDFIDRQHAQGKPWFVWMNSSRMHFWTHVRAENRGKSGLNEYAGLPARCQDPPAGHYQPEPGRGTC